MFIMLLGSPDSSSRPHWGLPFWWLLSSGSRGTWWLSPVRSVPGLLNAFPLDFLVLYVILSCVSWEIPLQSKYGALSLESPKMGRVPLFPSPIALTREMAWSKFPVRAEVAELVDALS